MDTANLSDENLLESLDHLVTQERELLIHVLLCLMEVDRRRLFSRERHESLFDFAVKRLSYSEDQACRRIQAMRALRELPELRPPLEAGQLSLTNLCLALTHIRTEEKVRGPLPREEKLMIFQLVTSVPRFEAIRSLHSISSLEFVPRADSDRPVTADLHEIRVTVPKSTSEKTKVLFGKLAHTHPFLTLGELFTLLCDLGLERWGNTTASIRVSLSPLHRQIWERDGGRCTHCGSTHALEVDHIRPKAQGGTDGPENLRLLCRSCNQRAAIEKLGQEKMDPFLNQKVRAGAASS